MRVGDLIDRARAAVAAGVDPAVHGLARLPGGMSHEVFVAVDDTTLVAKVFRAADGDEPAREWDALVTLAGSGIAPEPLHFDGGDPPIVAMTRVSGSPIAAGELGIEHARIIGAVHRRVHRAVPSSRRPLAHSGVRAARTSLMNATRHEISSQMDSKSEAGRAWRAAQTWVATADVERLLSSDELRFSRGDPNLSNYLWSGDRLVLVDWENSGPNDPALELADMAEHASTRALSERFWADLADATELTEPDRARATHGRRLMACFWLVLIESRQRQGLPTTVTLEEQARRTLAVLDG